jgi:cytoskeletal protein CcmA (bactofilin family)
VFGSSEKNLKSRGAAHTLISATTEVQGDIRFSGELIIEGHLTGSILADDDSDAVLRISEEGRVDGNINVPTAVINGHVKGDIRVARQLELAAKARIHGTVYYQLLEMVMGAKVNGSLICDTSVLPGTRVLLGQDLDAVE